MSRSTRRPAARAATRPDFRRWLLAGATIATLSLLWTSFASAQSAESASVAVAAVAGSDAPSAAAPDAPAPVAVQAVVGPRMPESSLVSRASVERRLSEATTAAPAANMAASEPGFRRNVALLAVGIAAIAIGSSVDDGPGTVLILGGAGLTLYGLYQILK